MLFAPQAARVASAEHLVKSLGITHTEVDLVLVNGEVADLSHRIRDRISVFPHFRTLDLGPDVLGCESHVLESRFALDAYLGKLATYLRLVGFDTVCTIH